MTPPTAEVVTLTCRGRDDIQTTLPFTVTRATGVWRYTAWNPEKTDFFEAAFKDGPPGLLYVDVITHNGAHAFFHGRGVPEAVFADLAARTGHTIVSSTNSAAERLGNEFRSSSAERMWVGLSSRGRATYSPSENRYYFVTA